MLTFVHETVCIDQCGMLSESPLIPINSRMLKFLSICNPTYQSHDLLFAPEESVFL